MRMNAYRPRSMSVATWLCYTLLGRGTTTHVSTIDPMDSTYPNHLLRKAAAGYKRGKIKPCQLLDSKDSMEKSYADSRAPMPRLAVSLESPQNQAKFSKERCSRDQNTPTQTT